MKPPSRRGAPGGKERLTPLKADSKMKVWLVGEVGKATAVGGAGVPSTIQLHGLVLRPLRDANHVCSA